MIAGLGAAVIAYALYVEPYRLEVTHPEVFVPALPPALDGLSILFLTDPHVSHWGKREAKLITLLRDVPAPDLLVWGGDFLQGSQGIPQALRLCREVRALFPDCPAYAILGNAEHKLSGPNRRVFVAKLRATGLRVLVNEHEPLTLRGETMTIAGTDDPYYGWAFLEDTLRGAPIGERFTLLLSHSPQIHLQAARAGADFMLSGHTHGGQVRLPIYGPVKTQNPLGRRMDMGTFDRARLTRILGRDPGGDLVTFIGRGIGLAMLKRVSWFAPRLLCRPEIARVVLRCLPPSK